MPDLHIDEVDAGVVHVHVSAERERGPRGGGGGPRSGVPHVVVRAVRQTHQTVACTT